jgi:hypothetical protein
MNEYIKGQINLFSQTRGRFYIKWVLKIYKYISENTKIDVKLKKGWPENRDLHFHFTFRYRNVGAHG